mmetsp:Transcript_9788/g.28961  ORF Transcript_9788/g.28961 Transcript_9788/m.28961 type:complete len:571 (+) Transcript_9788:84-1796(+)
MVGSPACARAAEIELLLEQGVVKVPPGQPRRRECSPLVVAAGAAAVVASLLSLSLLVASLTRHLGRTPSAEPRVVTDQAVVSKVVVKSQRYVILAGHWSCGPHLAVETMGACREAATELGFRNPTVHVIDKTRMEEPARPGCFYQEKGKYAGMFFNGDLTDWRTAGPGQQPICKRAPYTVLGKEASCEKAFSITSRSTCEEAAIILGLNLTTAADLPSADMKRTSLPGCFWQTGGAYDGLYFNDDFRDRADPGLGQEAICFESKMPARTTKVFDCLVDLKNAGRAWSDEKKEWCCANEVLGCAFDCQEGYTNWQDVWSEDKKEWCCENRDLACPFDCQEGYANWELEWSRSKSSWCCVHRDLGCRASVGEVAEVERGHHEILGPDEACGPTYIIDSLQSCERAARELGLNDTKASLLRSRREKHLSPPGCFWQADVPRVGLYFNEISNVLKGKDGIKDAPGYAQQPICKRARYAIFGQDVTCPDELLVRALDECAEAAEELGLKDASIHNLRQSHMQRLALSAGGLALPGCFQQVEGRAVLLYFNEDFRHKAHPGYGQEAICKTPSRGTA